MTGETSTETELWRELPAFRDAESCIAAGLVWSLKLSDPQLVIPSDVEERINSAKLGKCKGNIALSWILGALEVFKEKRITIFVEHPDYQTELREALPKEFLDRVDVEFGIISSREVKSGHYGVCAILVDKFMLDGSMHIVHTVVVNPQTAGKGDWITYSDPWSGKQSAMLPDTRFDEAIFGLNWLLGWGKLVISAKTSKDLKNDD